VAAWSRRDEARSGRRMAGVLELRKGARTVALSLVAPNGDTV
jgi:hypothetical protein